MMLNHGGSDPDPDIFKEFLEGLNAGRFTDPDSESGNSGMNCLEELSKIAPSDIPESPVHYTPHIARLNRQIDKAKKEEKKKAKALEKGFDMLSGTKSVADSLFANADSLMAVAKQNQDLAEKYKSVNPSYLNAAVVGANIQQENLENYAMGLKPKSSVELENIICELRREIMGGELRQRRRLEIAYATFYGIEAGDLPEEFQSKIEKVVRFGEGAFVTANTENIDSYLNNIESCLSSLPSYFDRLLADEAPQSTKVSFLSKMCDGLRKKKMTKPEKKDPLETVVFLEDFYPGLKSSSFAVLLRRYRCELADLGQQITMRRKRLYAGPANIVINGLAQMAADLLEIKDGCDVAVAQVFGNLDQSDIYYADSLVGALSRTTCQFNALGTFLRDTNFAKYYTDYRLAEICDGRTS